jgi:ribonuclease VapC
MLRDETGGAMVASASTGARMNAVNLAEVISHFIHAGMPRNEADAMLAPLLLTVVDGDAAPARIAGRLRKVTSEAGLSSGDRFYLALATRDRLPAWIAGG